MSRPEGNPSPQEAYRTTYNNLQRVSVVRPADPDTPWSTAPGAHNPATAARCPNRTYISMHPVDLLEVFGWGDAERLAAPGLYVALLEAIVDGHMLGSGPYAAYLATGAAPARPGGAANPPEFEEAIATALLMNMAEEDEDGDEDDEDDEVFDADDEDEDDGGLVDDDEDKMVLEAEAEGAGQAQQQAQQQEGPRSVRRRKRSVEAEGEEAPDRRAGRGRKRTRTRYREAAATAEPEPEPASHADPSSLKRKWNAVEPASSGSARPRAEARWVGQTEVFAPPMRLPRNTLQLFSVYMPDTEEEF
ncbi:hypothetical protein UCDDS831_g04229 [Diplodia seriata]|uniref:Uncharacterized protein n=1 Tax=Diplodia seriata TaxID=420778 RepID=A0A0G2GCN7_9PEZI|nr:hypothetical protein UCDDS831_g04229 [Diplodia seriata]